MFSWWNACVVWINEGDKHLRCDWTSVWRRSVVQVMVVFRQLDSFKTMDDRRNTCWLPFRVALLSVPLHTGWIYSDHQARAEINLYCWPCECVSGRSSYWSSTDVQRFQAFRNSCQVKEEFWRFNGIDTVLFSYSEERFSPVSTCRKSPLSRQILHGLSSPQHHLLRNWDPPQTAGTPRPPPTAAPEEEESETGPETGRETGTKTRRRRSTRGGPGLSPNPRADTHFPVPTGETAGPGKTTETRTIPLSCRICSNFVVVFLKKIAILLSCLVLHCIAFWEQQKVALKIVFSHWYSNVTL